MDNLSPEERSRRMAMVRSKNTKPELRVRRLIYSLGFRYRLHDTRLPGKPDMVFWGKRKIIFVHGCFWHRHQNCALARLPKSKLEFWKPKLEGNRIRDTAKLKNLRQLGWKVKVVWECEIKDLEKLTQKLQDFLQQEGQ